MPVNNNFKINLKALRGNKKLTQSQLADDLIIRRSTIGAYEEGRAVPTLDKLIIMADYFGITVDKLIK